MFDVSDVVVVVVEFLICELSMIIEFASKEFSHIIELVTSVANKRDSLICEFVELEFVRLELYTNEFVSIMESDAFELLNNES
jgi:hypothetical protein